LDNKHSFSLYIDARYFFRVPAKGAALLIWQDFYRKPQAHFSECLLQHKEHEVMTGSVPSISLSALSPCGVSQVATCAPASAKTAVRQPGTRKTVLVMVGTAVVAAWLHLRLVNQIWRERRMLAALDDAALKDIGLNRADVERETSRSPLDLPRQRHRWE
jgi:uncharacterized protein YjiS (DUF1127 family)